MEPIVLGAAEAAARASRGPWSNRFVDCGGKRREYYARFASTRGVRNEGVRMHRERFVRPNGLDQNPGNGCWGGEARDGEEVACRRRTVRTIMYDEEHAAKKKKAMVQ